MSPPDEDRPITVEVARTVRIGNRDSGKVILELTNRNGDVSVKRVSTSGPQTVSLEDLGKAVAQL